MPMGLRDCKRDDRPQRGAWAPGNYMNKCCRCGCGFIGDKRAHECADCAYDPRPRPPEYTWHIVEWMLWKLRIANSVLKNPPRIVNTNVN